LIQIITFFKFYPIIQILKTIFNLVEAVGIEPTSASPLPLVLHV